MTGLHPYFGESQCLDYACPVLQLPSPVMSNQMDPLGDACLVQQLDHVCSKSLKTIRVQVIRL